RTGHIHAPVEAPVRFGASVSVLSSSNRTPASRSARTASALKTYVRSGSTMPGECRSKMGNAFASSVFVKRIACFMNVLQSRYSSRHQSTVKANEHQYTSREMPGALDALPPDVNVIWIWPAQCVVGFPGEIRTLVKAASS